MSQTTRVQSIAAFFNAARLWKVAAISVAAVVAAGCSAGRVSLLSLNFQRIESTGPLIEDVRPTESYYWLNDSGQLCIAMAMRKTCFRPQVAGEEFYLSIVLDELPADSARTYKVNSDTFRGRQRAGLSTVRFASLEGIVGVWNYGKGELRGRFQFRGLQQSYLVLMGWAYTRSLIGVGEFRARPDRKRGEALLSRTEQEAMKRRPPEQRAPHDGQPRLIEEGKPQKVG